MNTAERNDFIHYTAMVQPKIAGTLSGDAYKVMLSEEECTAVIVDGLGSGAEANASATAIVKEFEKNPNSRLDYLLSKGNEQMIGMRGAVAALIRVRFKERIIEFSSIGNISCYIFRKNPNKVIYPRQKMGYLSGMEQQFSVQALSYEEGDFFLLHSDGLGIDNVKALLSEEEFIRVQFAQSSHLEFHNDDSSFIAGRLF